MVHISVTVDDDHIAQIGAVAAQLRKSGMDVQQVLDGLGVITGEVPDDRAGTLSRIAGVASVDPEMRFQVPPPDSPVQ